MRTTVTLDPDVQALLQTAVRDSGKPFKTTINDAIRAGLRAPSVGVEPPQWPCYDLGVPLVDLTKALALADELDDQDRIAAMSSSGSST